MSSSAKLVVPSKIFQQISAEEQNCSNAIKAKTSEIKIYFYSTLAFGAILAFGTIAIACTKPFNRMRVVQLATFFSVIGSIVGFCARRYENLKEELLEDTKKNYGRSIPSKGLTVEQQKLILRRNYYQEKFENHSRELTHYQQERIVQDKMRVQASICKVQVAYIQVSINNFSILPEGVQQNLEPFKGTIFTFVSTPLSPSVEDQGHVQDGQYLVEFGPFNKHTLTEIEGMRMEDIALMIESKMQQLVQSCALST